MPLRGISKTLQRCLALLICASVADAAVADELILNSGFRLNGRVLPMSGLDARTISQNNNTDVPAATYWMCDDGVRRFFVQKQNVADILEAPVSRGVLFELTHQRRGSRGIPMTIGLFEKTEFDKFGRRLIELRTIHGAEPIHQSITEIRPEYLTVDSTSHKWVVGLDVSTIRPERLREIIEQSIDPQRVDDRKAIVAFFIQIGRFLHAREEVEEIAAEFPEQAGWAEEMRVEIEHLNALNALQEVRRRQGAGQYGLAYEFARKVPVDRVSADVHREARDIVAEIDGLHQRIDRIGMLLDMLQAQLGSETAQRLAAPRAALLAELYPDNLVRLEPFLSAEIDEGLSPAQKLALAYSGWVVGGADAVTVLDEAVRLWDARFLVLEYLRSPPGADREQLLAELLKTEGVSLPRVIQIVERLPPPLAPRPVPAGQQRTIDVFDAWDEVQQQYTVSLPKEYSPHHEYPLLVVLHAGGMSPAQELTLWAGADGQTGPAQVRGYVTIAPHYAEEGDRTYDYSSEAHAAVLESINDARRRFRIDSDRIFLTGHGMGGDACFDLGMSHPGIFAGVIPINGTVDRYSRYYTRNDPQAAWYVVNGELSGDQRGMTLDLNAPELNEMMRAKQDVLYCEYKKRGFETYFEEFSRIFDWMAVHRRQPQPTRLGVLRGGNRGLRLMRPFDTRFHWLEIKGLPEHLSEPIVWGPPRPRVPRPLSVDASVKTASDRHNAFYIQHPGSQATIWLSPEVVDFDRRIKVTHKGRGNAFFDFVSPDIGVLLEDLRVRGDRQRLYWAKIEL